MKIGYFKIYSENKKYVGGIMVADERGIPVEFKYTEPVEPTKIQEVLYGDVLEKYLREEVIMANLVGKLENKPDIYIVNDAKNIYLQEIVKEDVVEVESNTVGSSDDAYDDSYDKPVSGNYIVNANENHLVYFYETPDLSTKKNGSSRNICTDGTFISDRLFSTKL